MQVFFWATLLRDLLTFLLFALMSYGSNISKLLHEEKKER